MISGIQAFSSPYAPYQAASAQRAQKPEQPFSVPASALRAEGANAPGTTRPTTAAQSTVAAQPGRDPVADAVELSRNYPQILLNQPYAPPPVQSVSADPRATPGLGQEMDRAAQGNPGAGIPGDPGMAKNPADPAAGEDPAGANGAEGAENENKPGEPDGADGQDMSNDEQAQVRELSNRDREVRAHEMAHQAVGGPYAGGASYEFQQGPDGQRYAVGGEVSIDMSPERDPEATIAKMQQVKAAAMAPAQPSGQDRSVAASATSTEMQARAELSAASSPGASGESESPGISPNPFTENTQQQTRANPYRDVASSANVLNLPNAYRAIDIVA